MIYKNIDNKKLGVLFKKLEITFTWPSSNYSRSN